MATNKKYVDLQYLIDFWSRVKLIPGENGTQYTVTLPTGMTGVNAKTQIVKHLEQLYTLAGTGTTEAAKHTTLTVVDDGLVKVTEGTNTDGGKKYTITLSTTFTDRVGDLETALTNYVETSSVKGGGTVSTWGDSAYLEVNGKKLTVTLPSDPTANIAGGTDDDGGISVAIDGDTLAPTVTVIPGAVATGNDSVVTGGAVYTAIQTEAAKAQKINVENQAITGGSLIAGTITVKTSKDGNGTADLKLTPTLTDTTGTAIATAEYVDAAVAGKKIEYSFGDNIELTKSATAGETYKASLQLYKAVDGGATSLADTVEISIDASEFVKDSYLKSATLEGNNLVLVMETSGGATSPITVNLSQFIDTYTSGNAGIAINATTKTISAVANANGYLNVTTSGIDVNTGKLQGYAATEATTGDNKIATKGYVDEKAKTSAVTVTLTGDVSDNVATVDAFGETGSINIKKGASDTTGKTLSVALPTFTEGTSTSGNVKVAIANDGKITTTTTEQGASDKTKYTGTALAQAGYVDEAVAAQKLTAGNGVTISDTNVISAKTTGYVASSASGLDINTGKITDVEGASSTGSDKNLVTKGYVDDAFKSDKVTITSDDLTIANTSGDGKTFTVDVPTASWTSTATGEKVGTDLFLFN